MKKYILRAPETDRKGVDVPTLLTDLTDYADSIAHGKAVSTPYHNVGNTGAYLTVNLDTASELINVTSDAVGLTVGKDGLYLILASTTWLIGGTIPGPTPRASTLLRHSAVTVNGVASGTLTNAPTDDGVDAGSFLLRLAAANYVTITAASTDGTSEGRLIGSISLTKIAP